MKILVLGNNYVADAFRYTFDVLDTEVVLNETLRDSIIDQYDVIINCIENKIGNLRSIWSDNQGLVQYLIDKCKESNKKLVYISTGDIYGNTYEWDETSEEYNKYSIINDFCLSKRIAERLIETSLENFLILRIKNPFDNRISNNNWIIENLKKVRHGIPVSVFIDSFTYLPNLVEITKKLLEHNQTGIWNIVDDIHLSVHHYFTNMLEIPAKKDYHTNKSHVYSDINNSKMNLFIDKHKILITQMTDAQMLNLGALCIQNYGEKDLTGEEKGVYSYL